MATKSFKFDDAKYYKSGDSVILNNMDIAGHIGWNGTKIRCCIPLSKINKGLTPRIVYTDSVSGYYLYLNDTYVNNIISNTVKSITVNGSDNNSLAILEVEFKTAIQTTSERPCVIMFTNGVYLTFD